MIISVFIGLVYSSCLSKICFFLRCLLQIQTKHSQSKIFYWKTKIASLNSWHSFTPIEQVSLQPQGQSFVETRWAFSPIAINKTVFISCVLLLWPRNAFAAMLVVREFLSQAKPWVACFPAFFDFWSHFGHLTKVRSTNEGTQETRDSRLQVKSVCRTIYINRRLLKRWRPWSFDQDALHSLIKFL